MKKSFLVLAALSTAFVALAQNTSSMLDHYMHVKNALVSGDGRAASAHIDSLYITIDKEEDFAQKAGLLKASVKLRKAGDNLDKQRAAFDGVSTAMWDVVKGSDQVDDAVYYQYCPMKKAHWLSHEEAIENPFYGSAMLTCGKVVDAKE